MRRNRIARCHRRCACCGILALRRIGRRASRPTCPTMRKINIGVSVAPPNVVHTSPYVAKELGFFAKRCIDANIIQFEGGAVGGRRTPPSAQGTAIVERAATSRSAAA